VAKLVLLSRWKRARDGTTSSAYTGHDEGGLGVTPPTGPLSLLQVQQGEVSCQLIEPDNLVLPVQQLFPGWFFPSLGTVNCDTRMSKHTPHSHTGAQCPLTDTAKVKVPCSILTLQVGHSSLAHPTNMTSSDHKPVFSSTTAYLTHSAWPFFFFFFFSLVEVNQAN